MPAINKIAFNATFYPRLENTEFRGIDLTDQEAVEEAAIVIHDEWLTGLEQEFLKASGLFSATFQCAHPFRNTIKIETKGELQTPSLFSGNNRAFRKLAKRDGERMLKNLAREYAKHRVKFEFEVTGVEIVTEDDSAN